MTFRCSMLAENPISRHNNVVEFQEEGPGGQEEWQHKWEKPEVTYAVIRGTEDIPEDSGEVIGMNLAMTTWDLEIPLVLKVVKKTENPDITVEFTDSDNEQYFKDKPSVLAFAYFPGQGAVDGIIKFNDDYRWSLNGKSEPSPHNPNTTFKTYNLIHTLIHEIGHSIGLRHSASQGHVDVMDPYYSGGVLDLSEEDIQRIVAKYNARVWDPPHHYERMKNWLSYRVRRF